MPFRLRHRPALVFSLVGALSGLGLVESCSRSAAEGPSVNLNASLPQPNPFPTRGFDIPRPRADQLPSLSPALPKDLPPAAHGADEGAAREAADAFAWQTFLSLNWPVRPDGSPDERKPPGQGGDNHTLWETWPEAAQVFLPEGSPRPVWGAFAPPPLPAAFSPLPPGARVMTRAGKDLSGHAPHAWQGPLVDQNGRHIRTEIRFNRPVFDTLLAQGLLDRRGQALAGPVRFPDGSPDDDSLQPGAIRVQAAWKILSPAEAAAGRFHSVQAFLHTPPAGDPTGAGSLEPATVGLVGLHIARKTPSAPGWVWFTFEHVDNCPTVGEPADRAAYNFFDKTKPGLLANQAPPPPWNPALVEPAHRRSQIIRQTPLPLSTRMTNAAYQAALRSIDPTSVWQYYELVGTEYRPAADSARPLPARVANTTLETYLAAQSTGPSCIACHAKAESTASAPADSSFLLRLAR